MNPLPAFLYWTASVVMEISYIYPWTAFTLDALFQRNYPFSEAVGVFVLGLAIAALSRGRGWRVLQILSIYGAGLTFILLLNIYTVNYQTRFFWNMSWLEDFIARKQGIAAWTTLVAFWIWTLVFWIRGIGHPRRSTSYFDVCSRFDKGLGLLFALLVFKLLIRNDTGVTVTETASDALIFPFFLFGLLAVALARNRGHGRKTFASGYRGLGLMITFGGAVILCGVGLVTFFLPHLRTASKAGYGVLTTAGGPFASILAKILLFVFDFGIKVSRNRAQTLTTSERAGTISGSVSSDGAGVLSDLFGSVLGVFVGLAFALFVAMGTWYVLRWLLSKTRSTERERGTLDWLKQWLERCIAYLYRIGIILSRAKKEHGAIRTYRALLRWGRRSGIPNRSSETPLEYGCRLKQQFSTVTNEIDTIISLYNLHVYSQKSYNERILVQARRALKKVKSPRLWPRRTKTWLLGG
jgi:hypothetical protein